MYRDQHEFVENLVRQARGGLAASFPRMQNTHEVKSIVFNERVKGTNWGNL